VKRIVLIEPRALGYHIYTRVVIPRLGTILIGTILRDLGYEVEVIVEDLMEPTGQELLSADLVGISTITNTAPRAYEIADRVRAAGIPVVMGGFHPTFLPDEALDHADYVVRGEGEETIVELCDALESGRDLATVRGIAYRDGDTVRINERRPLVEDIDSLPWPAYDLFPIEVYRLLRMPHITNREFAMPLLSGRGCTFTCNFCYRMDQGFRPRSAEAIVEEIRFLKSEYRISYIAFSDELLMSSKRRTEEICRAFLKARLDIKVALLAARIRVADRILGLMREAGCVFINYGIEAFDDRILRNMNKALTTKQIVRGIENTLAAGISPGLNIIFGNIGENRETLQKGVAFLLKYDDGAQMRTIRPVTPYPGSPLYYHAI